MAIAVKIKKKKKRRDQWRTYGSILYFRKASLPIQAIGNVFFYGTIKENWLLTYYAYLCYWKVKVRTSGFALKFFSQKASTLK